MATSTGIALRQIVWPLEVYARDEEGEIKTEPAGESTPGGFVSTVGPEKPVVNQLATWSARIASLITTVVTVLTVLKQVLDVLPLN